MRAPKIAAAKPNAMARKAPKAAVAVVPAVFTAASWIAPAFCWAEVWTFCMANCAWAFV